MERIRTRRDDPSQGWMNSAPSFKTQAWQQMPMALE